VLDSGFLKHTHTQAQANPKGRRRKAQCRQPRLLWGGRLGAGDTGSGTLLRRQQARMWLQHYICFPAVCQAASPRGVALLCAKFAFLLAAGELLKQTSPETETPTSFGESLVGILLHPFGSAWGLLLRPCN